MRLGVARHPTNSYKQISTKRVCRTSGHFNAEARAINWVLTTSFLYANKGKEYTTLKRERTGPPPRLILTTTLLISLPASGSSRHKLSTNHKSPLGQLEEGGQFVGRQGRRDCSRRRLAPGSYHSPLTHNPERGKSYAHAVPEKKRTQERANLKKM